MNQLLRLKRIDIYVQLAAIILPWLLFMLLPAWGRVFQLEHLLASYFIVGAVQIASCLANKFRLQPEYKARGREWYERALMVLVILVPASYMLKVLLFAFVVLLYASPAMAIWYVVISLLEIKRIKFVTLPASAAQNSSDQEPEETV